MELSSSKTGNDSAANTAGKDSFLCTTGMKTFAGVTPQFREVGELKFRPSNLN